MNEQVRRYLDFLKSKRLKDAFYAGTIYEDGFIRFAKRFLYIEMAVGTGLNIEFTQEDLDFVHTARKMCKQAGIPAGHPPAARLLQARYVALHPLPLHNFRVKEIRGETRDTQHMVKVGIFDGTEEKPTAVVNKQLYGFYAATKAAEWKEEQKKGNNGVLPKKLQVPKFDLDQNLENDKKVGEWYAKENKNAIIFVDPTEAREKGNQPSAQIKYLNVGTDHIDIAVRNKGPVYAFTEVKGIPLDFEKFRAQVERFGYNERRHAKAVLNMGYNNGWQDFIKNKPDEGSTADEEGLHKFGFGKKTKFSPGYDVLEEDQDEEFVVRYKDDMEFRSAIEKAVVSAFMANVNGVKIANTGNDKEGMPRILSLNYEIKAAPNNNIDESDAAEIMQDTRKFVLGQTKNAGFDWKTVPVEDILAGDKTEVGKWIKTKYSSGIQKYFRSTLKQKGLEKAGFTGAEDGGRGDLTNLAVDKGPSVSVRTDLVSKDIDDIDPELDKLTPNSFANKIRPMFIQWFQKGEKPDRKITRLIFRHSKADDPEVAKAMGNIITALKLTDPSEGTPGKYEPVHPDYPASRNFVQVGRVSGPQDETRRYTFRQYLEWRMGGR